MILFLAYIGAYCYQMLSENRESLRLIMLATAAISMLAMAFILTNNMTLMLRPATWDRYFDNPGGSLLNISDPMFWPRYLHMVTGALAMGGLFRAMVGRWKLRRGDRQGSVFVKSGLRWFLSGSALQVGFGFWLLLALRQDVMVNFLGKNNLATGLLVLGITGAALALMFGIQTRVAPTAVAALITVVSMVLIRDMVRRMYLEGYFVPQQLQYTSRYVPFAVFMVFVALGAVVLYYLYRRLKEPQS